MSLHRRLYSPRGILKVTAVIVLLCILIAYIFLYKKEPNVGSIHSAVQLYKDGHNAPDRILHLGKVGLKELFDRLVIVTAISQNHVQEAKGMIGTVQRYLPSTRIILYDLGLNASGLKEVQRLCNVRLRPFDFTKYPSHVKTLKQYAWKPIIISETLDEFGVIFWCDASARFIKDPRVLLSLLEEQHGFMFYVEEYISNQMILRTHPKAFREIGVDVETFRADDGYVVCIEANRLLFANTALIREKIMAPWVECALRPACISPWFSVIKERVNILWWHTHRFDQAALSLIVYKNLRGVWYKHNDKTPLFNGVVWLIRNTLGWEKAKFCS